MTGLFINQLTCTAYLDIISDLEEKPFVFLHFDHLKHEILEIRKLPVIDVSRKE